MALFPYTVWRSGFKFGSLTAAAAIIIFTLSQADPAGKPWLAIPAAARVSRPGPGLEGYG
jgi:hypothetical protein